MDGIAVASGAVAAATAASYAVTPRLKGRDRWEDASLLLGTFLYPWVVYRGALEVCAPSVVTGWAPPSRVGRGAMLALSGQMVVDLARVVATRAGEWRVTVVHHLVVLGALGYSLLNGGRLGRFMSGSLLAETSTVFLNLMLGMRDAPALFGASVPHAVHIANGAGLWMSFMLFRVAMFPALMLSICRTAPADSTRAELGALHATGALMWGMSAYWMVRIHRGLAKRVAEAWHE